MATAGQEFVVAREGFSIDRSFCGLLSSLIGPGRKLRAEAAEERAKPRKRHQIFPDTVSVCHGGALVRGKGEPRSFGFSFSLKEVL